MNDRNLALISGGLLVASTIGLAFALGTSDQLFRSRAHRPHGAEPPRYQALLSALDELHRTWKEDERDRVLARIRGNASAIEGPLLWVVARSEHPRFEEAAALAGALPVPSCRPLLEGVAWSARPVRRAPAILAVEAIDPWPRPQLVALLQEREPDVVAAALRVCAARDDRPVELIVEHVFHPAEKVRDAALGALPGNLAQDQLQRILDRVQLGDQREATAALAALGRIEWGEDTEPLVLETLDIAPAPTQVLLLDALAGRGRPLQDADPVWLLVVAGDRDLGVRTSALRCLEATGSYDVDRLRSEVWDLPPLLRYHAARCLVRANQRMGLDVLLDLAGRSDEGEVPDVVAGHVAARRLLAELSGTRLHDGIRAWEEWAASLESVPSDDLPAAPHR